MNAPTELPADVLAMIGPAVTAVQEETRAATLAAEATRLQRVGEAAIRSNGEGYGPGVAAILSYAVDVEMDVVEESCQSQYSCCGYCNECDTHHGESEEADLPDDGVIVIPCHRNRLYHDNHRWCTDCEHDCGHD